GFSGGLSGTTTPQNLTVSAPATVTASFVTPQGQATLITAQVQALVTAGILTSDQGAGLTDKLNAIIAKLNSGQTGAACNQLSAFINQVGGFVNSRALTPAQGQALIDAANAAKTAIGC